MQGLGSAITYARRYSLASIFAIGQDDDDGNAAVQNNAPQTSKLEPQKTVTPTQQTNGAKPRTSFGPRA